MTTIEKTLDALRQRLVDNSMLIQYEGAIVSKVTCTFNSPASEKEISRVSELSEFDLPREYVDMLRYSNGFRLFDDIYNGGYQIYSVDEVFEDYNLVRPPDHWIPIGGYCGDLIYIDTSKKETGYLIFQDPTEIPTPTYRFTIGLSDWLEKLILAQGNQFWRWWEKILADNKN